MRARTIGVLISFFAAVCFTSWGDEQDKPASATEKAPARAKSDASKSVTSTKKPAPPHATEAEDKASEQTIRSQTAALIGEYNAKNTAAFGNWFLPEAEYETEDGNVLKGRAAIQKFFDDLFEKDPEVQARVETASVRLVSRNMAIEEGTIQVSHSPDEVDYESPYVAIWALVDGRWRLASVREMSAPEEPKTPHEHLEALDWLVGDWVDNSSGSVVKTTCRWTDNGNFLVQEFTRNIQGTNVMSGTHRIGWDPLRKKLRSWYFDSDGGYGEGLWEWDGKRWVIPASTVSPDGESGTAMNVLVPVDQDSYRWEMSHRVSDGEALPDTSVLIVRQGPVPARTEPPTAASAAREKAEK